MNLKRQVSVSNLIALCLCLIPVFDPYTFGQIGGFDIGVVDAVLAVIAAAYVWNHKGIPCVRSLFLFGVLLLGLNLVAFTTSLSGSLATSLRVWLFWAFYCVIFTAASVWADFKAVEKWALRIAVAACVLMIIQFIFLSLNMEVWNGLIPFLPLGKYDGWSQMVDVTGAIRVHAFFQEPSYLGVYLLPVTALALQRKKPLLALLFGVCILMSTSTLALGGLAMVVVWHMLCVIRTERSWKSIRIYVYGAIAVLVTGLAVCMLVPEMRTLVEYSIQKVAKILSDLSDPRMGSTRLRLLGNIFLFPDYPLANQLVGVGINQYTVVFAEQIQYAYSNSVVNMLLNSGLIGAVAFISLGVLWFVKSSMPNKIYPLLFMFAMCTDQMLFNWYFFYMLLWVLHGLKDSDKAVSVMHISWTGMKQCKKKVCQIVSGTVSKMNGEKKKNGQ